MENRPAADPVPLLMERLARYEAALLAILEHCPATVELTAAHDMAQIATQALDGDASHLEGIVSAALSRGWIDGYGHARDDVAAVRLKIGAGEMPIPLLTAGLDATLERLKTQDAPPVPIIERVRAQLIEQGRKSRHPGRT